MDKLFLTVLNMSLTGAFVIAAICLARLPLKKAPKIISYGMWAVAGLRLVFPFSIESALSLIPFKAQTIPQDIAIQAVPRIDSGILVLNNAVSGILPAATPDASMNPLQIWTAIGAYVWVFGVAVMLIYGVVSFIILKRKMCGATCIEANIYEADNIQSPFVLGIFTPKIYLPCGMSEKEHEYIVLHEQTHIRRCDHIVKFAAYFILCLHWFNPLAWVAFLLMGVDMEMSCDEGVLKELGGDTKKGYSLSLLSLATNRRIIGGSPLAFSEDGLKARIKNILNFKKHSRVIIIVAVALVAVLCVGLAVNRASSIARGNGWEVFEFPNEQFEQVFFECGGSPYNPEYTVISAQLMNNQNIHGLSCGSPFKLVQQVGNTWRIVPFTDGVGFDLVAFEIENGMSFDYSLTPEMLAEKLDEGNYRIVTEIWFPTDNAPTLGGTPSPDGAAFYNTAKHTVWADFTIDKNAPKQKTFELTMPIGAPEKTYTLENATDRQKLERLNYISLYSDGAALLSTPPISSYLLPHLTYVFSDGELLIYASIENEIGEGAFGVKNGDIIAIFTVFNDNTLVFKSATVPIFADSGARYVTAQEPTENLSPTAIVR